jgi:predicted metalloprotease
VRRTPGYRSRNVDDRRHRAAGGRGGASLLPLLFLLGRSRIGLLAILLIGGLLWLGGVDPLMLLTGGGAPASRVTPARDAAEAEMVDLVNVVFDDLQATWGRLLAGGGPAYREATLVLFRDAVESACGFAQSASGPFYCPGDEQIYIDLGFYEELRRGLGAPGDFAQAYVLAHEVGHHVQNVLGIEREVRALQRGRPEHVNPLSVRLELQADCFAGVWGRHADQQGLLDPGDLEEGLNAAAAIGDDRLQRSAGRTVNPDLFTHGSAAQRVSWLRRGFEGGEPSVCDTFADAG